MPDQALGQRIAPDHSSVAEAAEHLGFPVGRVQPLARTPMPPLLTLHSRTQKEPIPAPADVQQKSSASASDTDRVDRGTMIVGREISVSGDIDSCDRLVVDGTVEASLHECRDLDIAATGRFRGNASTVNADIRGCFTGDLVVRHQLIIRAGGHVSGTITYNQIQVENGGNVSGILMQETKRPVTL
jgi:cytoskeletal protein CcmA (bactofilin family)